MLSVDASVKEKYPGLLFGIMVMDQVHNPKSHEELDERKRILEENLREKYDGADRKMLRSKGPLFEYHNFYKKFKKSYYVQHQLESIALKGKSLPNVAALVEAMFMAEVKNQLLTAGYDCDKINANVHVELSDGQQSFMNISKQEKTPPAGDLIFAGPQVPMGSIICGPDFEHRITYDTTRAMFVIYGVQGISKEQMEMHFKDIEEYVKIVSPGAIVETVEIV